MAIWADGMNYVRSGRAGAWAFLKGAVLATALFMVGVGTVPARAADLPVPPSTMTCASLAGRLLDIEGIPARVVRAYQRSSETGDRCEVRGYVAPQVGFIVSMPIRGWTRRLLFLGCGGFCGSLALNPIGVAGCVPFDRGEFLLVSSELGMSPPAMTAHGRM
ncbi:Tannase and feruloyl esterase [Sphingomonas laterariae]|uniref:Tannase and feruloyl esterase n=1 Tax=Edaphosphingomonas laterariae TaxID=861865 RepID=A0A239KGS6_9SPHN|nr:tannase/feruloyl esterase family alpha/beta hydrolase [Sphingomonas laterariae]SNT16833.1 Tannase and feruloyl esterase [Sphingomonas laterariae]